jgi:hypothetical protein
MMEGYFGPEVLGFWEVLMPGGTLGAATGPTNSCGWFIASGSYRREKPI